MKPALHWYLQRVSGALLLALLIAHFWVEHFASEELLRAGVSYAAIRGRVSQPLWQWIDISFLLLALYHGLSGVRNMVLDYSAVGPRTARVVTVALVVVGGVWAWWGIEAFRNL